MSKCHKKLTKKAKAKICGQLYSWIQSISNHLWWAAQTCNGVLWTNGSLLYITFPMSMNGTVIQKHFPKCVHPTLSPEEQGSKKWLRLGSAAHSALCKVLLQETLLWDIKNFLVFIIPAH